MKSTATPIPSQQAFEAERKRFFRKHDYAGWANYCRAVEKAIAPAIRHGEATDDQKRLRMAFFWNSTLLT